MQCAVCCIPSLPLKLLGIDDQDNDQTSHHKGEGNERYERHAAPTRRKLAANDPVLAFEIAMETHKEHDDADPDEGGADRLAHAAKGVFDVGKSGAVVKRRIKPEELRDGDADRGEGDGCAKPGEKGAFCPGPVSMLPSHFLSAQPYKKTYPRQGDL